MSTLTSSYKMATLSAFRCNRVAKYRINSNDTREIFPKFKQSKSEKEFEKSEMETGFRIYNGSILEC